MLYPCHIIWKGSLLLSISAGQFYEHGKDGVAEEECNFSAEVKLGAQDPIWKEKYQPRKPRFFNRVHTVSLEG